MPQHPSSVRPALPRSTYLVAVLLFVFFLARYLSSLTDVHTFDALSYVLDVDRKPWTEMFHPHHLAYGPLGALSLATARALGYGGTAAEPLQVVNAVAGALGVSLFFLLARRASGCSDAALVAGLLLGGSYAFWYYAVEVEVYTLAVLFLIICLGVMLRLLRQPMLVDWVALGVAQALAVLFHQTNVLLCVPALLVWLSGMRHHRPHSLRDLVANGLPYILYLATLGGLVAFAYAAVGVFSGFASWDQFFWWMTSYARTGWWGGPITERKWELLGKGLSETLAQPGGALLALLLVGLGVAHGRALVLRHGRLLVVLLGWLVVYGGFFLWWEPDNVEFWIGSLPPVFLLLALALAGAARWRPGVWIGLAVACTVLAVNGEAIAWRGDSTKDVERQVTTLLAERSTPADLLLIPDGMQELYLPYYADRFNYLSLNQALYDSRGDIADGVPLTDPQGLPYWRETCEAIQARIEHSLGSGVQVVIGDEVVHPPALLLQRHQLSREQVESCFAPYQSHLQNMNFPRLLPTYWRLPTAQELAEGPGWDFTSDRWGWQAVNSESVGFDNGWLLRPAEDGRIESPLLHLDSSEFSAIDITLANTTRARDAQLFFGDEQGLMEDARSVRWRLDRGEIARTYRIELADQPGWSGTITRLRFDPVSEGDGGTVRVESIRLIK